MEKKFKIFKVFYDQNIINKLPQYDIIFAHPNPEFYSTCYNIRKIKLDIQKCISLVHQTIKDNQDIDGVIMTFDLETLLTCAVMEEYTNLKVKLPSFESVFTCCHKFYEREKERDAIKYTFLDLNEDLDKNIAKILKFPFYIKPPELFLSLHQNVINTTSELIEKCSILKEKLPLCTKDYREICETFLNMEKFPLANKNIIICEELITDAEQINWEGWADEEGDIHTYSFVDEVISCQGIFSDFIIPSKQSNSTLKKVEEVCKSFLKSIDFKNGFANIELWIRNEDEIKIIEVNPRSAYPYYYLYNDFFGRNLYDDIIRCSMAKYIEPPFENNANKYASQSVIATKLNGKMSEILNYRNIEIERNEHPEYIFSFLIEDPEFEIKDNFQVSGRVLLRINFTKNSYSEIEKESLRLKQAFLLKDCYYLKT